MSKRVNLFYTAREMSKGGQEPLNGACLVEKLHNSVPTQNPGY